MRDIEIRNALNIKLIENDAIDALIKDIVRFTHKRDEDLSPIIETYDFYEGIKYTIAYLIKIKNIQL